MQGREIFDPSRCRNRIGVMRLSATEMSTPDNWILSAVPIVLRIKEIRNGGPTARQVKCDDDPQRTRIIRKAESQLIHIAIMDRAKEGVLMATAMRMMVTEISRGFQPTNCVSGMT